MGIGFVIIIQLIALATFTGILSIIVLILTLLFARKQRRRKSIVHFFLPFLFSFSLYFFGLLGMGIISSIKKYDIGLGDYFTIPLTENTQLSMIDTTDIAYLEKGSEDILHSITKVDETDTYYYFELTNQKRYSYQRTNEQLIELTTDTISKAQYNWVSTSEFYQEKRTSYWLDAVIVGFVSLGLSSWICVRVRQLLLSQRKLI